MALWDLAQQKVRSRLACHAEPLMSLDFDPQQARGVSGSADKTLAVWSVDERQALQVRVRGPRGHLSCAARSPDRPRRSSGMKPRSSAGRAHPSRLAAARHRKRGGVWGRDRSHGLGFAQAGAHCWHVPSI